MMSWHRWRWSTKQRYHSWSREESWGGELFPLSQHLHRSKAKFEQHLHQMSGLKQQQRHQMIQMIVKIAPKIQHQFRGGIQHQHQHRTSQAGWHFKMVTSSYTEIQKNKQAWMQHHMTRKAADRMAGNKKHQMTRVQNHFDQQQFQQHQQHQHQNHMSINISICNISINTIREPCRIHLTRKAPGRMTENNMLKKPPASEETRGNRVNDDESSLQWCQPSEWGIAR